MQEEGTTTKSQGPTGNHPLEAPMEPWMSDAKYSRFWRHYQDMQRWMTDCVSQWNHNCQSQLDNSNSGAISNHYQVRSRIPHGYEQNYWSHHNMHTQAHHTNPLRQNVHRTSHRKSARKSKHGSNPRRTVQDNSDVAMEWSEGTGEEDHFELEVSEEMKAFFAKSEEFRRERDKAKDKGQRGKGYNKSGKDVASRLDDDMGDKTDEIELSSSDSQEDIQVQTSAPKERPGVRRIVEMKELYGRHAAAIHGMETAIQLQFDRNYDRKKPALWPIVPLKM
ncbi:gem-associated protein 8-like [Amphiura filiformis]|uniref:gem-associated protein 8-like n=1 Tax=Amphiura filiformis TaxID=82378 RepID=UPI003B2273DE